MLGIQDVVSAAAVQLAALQPVALVQPGTDMSAAAGEQKHHRWDGNQHPHVINILRSFSLLKPVVITNKMKCKQCVLLRSPFLDFCSPQRGDLAEGQNEDEQQEENAAEFDEDRTWLEACTCFIRTRYNIQLFTYV